MSDFDPNTPIYVQIVDSIKRDIVTGELKPGDRLSSVRERAEALTVNHNTVQRAYQELEREGVSETRRGTGSFIVERESLIESLKSEMAESILDCFVEGMRALGYSPRETAKALTDHLAQMKGGIA